MKERHTSIGNNKARRIIFDDDVVRQMHLSGMTALEIACVHKCSTCPVKKVLKRLGLSRAAKPRPGMFVGAKNPSWRGGRRIRSDGYVIVWTPDGDRLEHRIVMEAHLGRPLLDNEIVHHRNEDKQHNVPMNLEVMSQSDHARLHAPAMHAARYGH